MPHRSTCVSSTAFVSANHFPAVCKIDQNCLNIKYWFKSALHCAPPPKSAQIRPKPGRWRRRREREPGPCTERPWPCGLRHAAVDVLGRSTASPSRPRLAGAFPDSKRDVQRSNQSIYASLLSLPSLRSLSKFTIPIEKNRFNADSKQIFWGLCCWFPFVIRCLQATPPWCGSNCNSMQIEQPMHGLLDQISLTWRNCYEITHRIHVWYIY